MDRLQTMEVFIAVAETGGFARAAGRLRLSPSVVTRAVAALEARLGVPLFHRTTRHVAPTEAGLRFLAGARAALQQLDAAEKDAAGEMAEPTGLLGVAASVTFGRRAVAPVIAEFLAAHPRVQVSLMLMDRVINLVEEGVDVAVRIGELPDSSLVARRLGTVRRVLVASPAYLARAGTPEAPEALRAHQVIAFTGALPNREWRHVQGGRRASLRLVPRFEVNDAQAAISLALAGEGITAGFSYMVAEDVRAGRLVPLLQAFAPPPVPVHIVYPQARLVAPKLRAFVELATPRLRARLAGDLAPVATPGV
jgi:DNA-binding transcriptional LysR family regulator